MTIPEHADPALRRKIVRLIADRDMKAAARLGDLVNVINGKSDLPETPGPDELAASIIALLPQPSPGEYGPLIEEARRWAEHEGLGALVKRLITRLADALSSALRERDKWKSDYVDVQKVNADWSAYDKGVREAGKALVASALASPVNRISADMQQFWDAVQALRSALSLVPESKDNGS